MYNDEWENKLDAFLKEKAKKAKKVKHLDLSKRKISWGIYDYHYDHLFKPFKNLESIDLSDNIIDTVVIDLSRYEQLRSINLCGNDLKHWGNSNQFNIGKEINNQYITYLDLSYGNLGHITINKAAPFRENLKVLHLSGSNFPFEEKKPVLRLEALPNLETLTLRFNYYKHVPKLRYLPSIQNLDLSLNALSSNYQELLNLPRLKNLSLKGMKWRHIPRIFERFKHLETLDLQLNELPEGEIKKLQRNLPNTKILADDPSEDNYYTYDD